MLVEHYRKEFMELIIGQRVIIVANQDVDSVCTVKILTTLFQTEGVEYILLSIESVSDMKAKYDEYSAQSNWFVMVNCGASIDLLDALDNPPITKTFYIIDHHRPLHILNYFNASDQIRFISAPEADETIPDFDQIYREDPEFTDSEEDDRLEDDDELDEDGIPTRLSRRANRNQRMSEHDAWLKKREEILFNYREYTYYARPSALYALEVAWVMTRDDMESIWCAIISLTEFFVNSRISRAKYTDFASTLNDHILRITKAEKLPRDCLKISLERELLLFLYRNWSVYESAKKTPYIFNSLKTWTYDGNRRFHQMLAHLGLPLAEVKQKYVNMSLDLRKKLIEMFTSDTVTERFRLPDVVYGSFLAEIGFRQKFSALDVVLATIAVLNDPDKTKTVQTKFMDSMQVLSVKESEPFTNGVEKAKTMIKIMYSQVQIMVDAKQMQEVGPFLILQLSDSIMDYNFFNRPNSIPFLAHSLQHAGIKLAKKNHRQSPWIIMIPLSAEQFIAVGVQPGSYEQAEKNIFGEVFRVLETKMPEDITLDYLDAWAILVKSSKRQLFTDQLLAISEY